MNPIAATDADAVAALGETALIARVRAALGEVAPPAPEGPGDDCAALDPAPFPGRRLVTTDAVILGRHFDAATGAAAAGRKLVNRNLSDIAAMGGVPADAVLALILGPDISAAWLEDFVGGMRDAARPVGLRIVGGDLARAATGLFIASLTLTGFAVKPLLRTGAMSGDFIYVTGELGGSILGRHHAFAPRLAEGRFLAAHPAVRSGMDLTDGPAKDLPELLPPNCAALLDLDALPISPDAHRVAASSGLPVSHHALNDGEDYELAVTVSAEGAEALESAFAMTFPGTRLTRIGRITPAAGLAPRRLHDALGAIIPPGGYDHFRG